MSKILINDGAAYIDVTKKSAGEFEIVTDSLTVKNGDSNIDATALGFESWDDAVNDLDNGQSDESQCFGISTKLQWNNVILKTEAIYANSLESIEDAFKHVRVIAYCPGDI